MKEHDKDLASRMQMTDVKTITREQLRQTIVYKNGNYSIDFRQLNVIDDNSFWDIDVKMVSSQIRDYLWSSDLCAEQKILKICTATKI